MPSTLKCWTRRAWAVVPSLIFATVVMAAGIGQTAPAAAKITMTEYKYSPERITVRAGQSVAITLANASSQKKLHEFMVGRKVAADHGGRPAGYTQDFFVGVAIKVSSVKGLWQLNEGKAKVTGATAKMEAGGMAMGDHEGFMIELQAGGAATLTFTVPLNRVGDWEIGCFSEAGEHYAKDMKGRLVVVK